MAHIKMLQSIGLLEKDELDKLLAGLEEILHTIEAGEFRIEDDVEDVHSQVEFLLTQRLGDLGKKSTPAARATTRYSSTSNCLCATSCAS